MKKTLILAGLLASACATNAAVILSSDFTGAGTAGNLTWDTQDAAITTISNLTAVGGPFDVLGNQSTVDDVTINDNLNDRTAKGFNFNFTTTTAFDLNSLAIDTGHLNSVGGVQAFDSDLVLTITQTAGGSYTYSDSFNIAYSNARAEGQLPQSFDLTGESIGAGTYTVQLHMIDNDNGIGGAFASYDNFSLDATAVPEPSSTALLGLAGLGLMIRRRL